MTGTWTGDEVGIVRLPSGRLVRGRGLRRPPPNRAIPDVALHLLGKRPPDVPWESVWVRWPDFGLPSDRVGFLAALRDAHRRALNEKVEIACSGGVGRTGTALACLAVIDGVPGDQAVAWVRAAYAPGAVETPWQKRFVRRFEP